MTRFDICRTMLWAVVFLTAAPAPLSAQSVSATISGRVTDSAGAIIVGAKLQLSSTDRGTVTEAATNDVGLYTFPAVQPGPYKLTAQNSGFKQAQADNITVDVGSQLVQNFQLQVGATSDSITVETAESLVNTVSSTVSSVVTGAPVQDLPLNGRDTLQLALTQPGVTPQIIGTPGGPSITGFAGNGFSIAGARSNSVTYMLDGGDNNSVSSSVAVVDPNPDTIAEFRILTNNYSAEYGRSNGGIVTVITKSGTNQIHGTLYDYLRNKDLNANNFFNQSTPGSYSPRPTLIRNQFGVTMGGPLSIPKLIHGKDRFFWFMGYQGQRQNSTTVGSQVGTFTPAELTGDFSHASNGGPSAGVVAFLQSHPYFQSNPALAAEAIIDPTKIDPVAKAFIAGEPIPTSPSGIITPQGTAQDNRDEFLGKTDFAISNSERLSLTLVRNHNPVLNPFPAANVPGYPGLSTGDQYFGGVGFTSIFTPSLLNEAHFTAQRLLSVSGISPTPLPTATSLGMKINPDVSDGPPAVSFSVEQLNLGIASSSPGQFADTTYSWTDNMSWIHGHHNFKFGGSYSIVQNNGEFAYETNGTLSFAGAVSSGGIGSGNDLADFLFGLPNGFSQFPNAFSAAHGKQYGIFAQDEWRVTPRFTLTLGLRYEYDTPKYDPHEQNYFLLPGQQSTKYPLAPEGLLFPCDKGAPCPGTYYPDKNNFAPRFGFAWDPRGNGRTSIRGGAGVFYDILNGQDVQWQNGTIPFYSASTLIYTTKNVPANGPATILSDPYGTLGVVNPFPSRPLSPATNFASAGFLPISTGSVFIDPNQRNPYTYGWNLTVQQALVAGMGLQVAYVGSSSHKLIVNEDPDSFIPGTTTRPLNTQPGLQYTNPYSYASVDKSIGSANYEGLLASITKRMGDSYGFGKTFFTAAYTYSNTMSDQDAYLQQISAYNQHQFYAPSIFDIRQRFVLSGGWELPFAHLMPKLPKAVTSGWSLFPILSTQTGLPVDFNAGLTRTATNPGPAGDGDVGLVRPDWAGGSEQMTDPRIVQTFVINGVARTGHFFFNPTPLYLPACFTSTAIPGTPGGCPTATYGDLQRNTLRGPGLTNFDLSLEKKTNIYGEKVQMLFRAEFFNVLNHTEFLGTFGQVSIRSALIGQSTSTKDPRIGQLALKFIF